nr:penicillin-binding protein 2 (PBP-2) [Raoultella sp. NCTC 9187]
MPPQAGRDIYLTLDLKLQQYIETLLAGSRAAVVVTDPRTGSVLALVSTPSYDPNLFVDGIQQGLLRAAQRSEYAAGQPRHAGGLSAASTVKPYVAVSALSATSSPAIPACSIPAGGSCPVQINAIATGKNGATVT